jgi:predicted dehydrogenase
MRLKGEMMSISVVIVGAGRMGQKHLERLSEIEDVRLVGVADVRREAADAVAAGSNAAVSTDYRELLERVRPDAVYFCTPPADHAEQVIFAAERGINIFVEKPLATRVGDAMAAAAAVERHNVVCTVGYQWRYNTATDMARETLGDAALTLLSAWWYATIPPVPWIRDRRTGGGQIFEQATHLIDLMRLFGGDVSTVFAAYAHNAVPEDDLPNWDANAATLRFDSGAVGSVHSTYALFPGIPGNNGLDLVARELLIRVHGNRIIVFRRDQEPVEMPTPTTPKIDRAFIDAVRRNDPGAIRSPAGESAASIAVSLAANYSAVTGKVVDMKEFVTTPPDDAVIMPDERSVFASEAT